MSGCLWLFLHGAALLFFFPALFVTIPLHLIAEAVAKKQ
jgi:hypothetical protein